ncbi:MAG: hypothetical protein KF832_12535 [Caldilineaceae bacterium]|nr:hypothetical protein [Caldilineaceae bacterium]
MAKVFFFNVPLAGHLNATLPVVRELVQREEEVHYFCGPAFQAAIEATGAVFRSLPVGFTHQGRQILSSFALVDMVVETTEKLLPELLATVAAEQPDYIVSDFFCRWGRLAAQLSGRPLITTHTIFVTTPHMMNRLSWQEGSAYLTHLPEFLPQWLHFRQRTDRLAKQYGIQRLTLRGIMLDVASDLNLVFTTPAFQPDYAQIQGRVQGNFVFVGPTIDERESHTPLPPHRLPTDKPLIYLSLGTLFNQDAALLNRWIEALAAMEVNAIVAYGKELTPERLLPKPANVLYMAQVPQLQVLTHAALFITHGGLNSVSESIYHQVPMIVLPQAADQFINAEQVEKHHIGIWQKRQQRPAALRELLMRVLTDPTIPQNLARLRQDFLEAGGYQRAAAEILAYVRRP